MKSDNKKTAEVRHTGTHSTRRSMTFEDFLLGIVALARLKDTRLEGVEDVTICKAEIEELAKAAKVRSEGV